MTRAGRGRPARSGRRVHRCAGLAPPAAAASLGVDAADPGRATFEALLEAAAEMASTAGDTAASRTIADELLVIGKANGRAEMAAVARRWQAETWLLVECLDDAGTTLLRCRDCDHCRIRDAPAPRVGGADKTRVHSKRASLLRPNRSFGSTPRCDRKPNESWRSKVRRRQRSATGPPLPVRQAGRPAAPCPAPIDTTPCVNRARHDPSKRHSFRLAVHG